MSDADRDAEAAILRLLRAERPDDAVLGEEGTSTSGSSGLRWVIDPLDGTVNFLYAPAGVRRLDRVRGRAGTLVGVVHQPLTGETFTAIRGGGRLARRRGARRAPARVAGARARRHRASPTSPSGARCRARSSPGSLPQVRDVRRAGSAALDLAWVACGRLDGYYEHGLNAWDWAGGALLVSEAGGVVRRLPAAGGLPACARRGRAGRRRRARRAADDGGTA